MDVINCDCIKADLYLWAVPTAPSLCTELTVLLTQFVVTPPPFPFLWLCHALLAVYVMPTVPLPSLFSASRVG